MTDRQRVRVGRQVSYFPTDAEAAAASDSAGSVWAATIAKVNADGTVNLHVVGGDGGEVPLTSIAQGQAKGTFSLTGGVAAL